MDDYGRRMQALEDGYEYPDVNLLEDFKARMAATGQALTAPPAPLTDPEQYMDESQVPRDYTPSGVSLAALRNAWNAFQAMQPDDSIPIGDSGMRLGSPAAIGQVGKYQLANKKGNVITAGREFQPIIAERKALEAANKEAMKLPPEREAIELIHAQRPFEFPDVDVSQFKTKAELQELKKRINDDWFDHQDKSYLSSPEIDAALKEKIIGAEGNVNNRIRALNDDYATRAEKAAETRAVKNIKSGEFSKKKTPDFHPNFHGLMNKIRIGAQEGDPVASKLFVEAFERGDFATEMDAQRGAFGKTLTALYNKLKGKP